MSFPSDDAFINDEELAVMEAAVCLVEVLGPLNRAVVELSKGRFAKRIQFEYLKHMSRAVSALYSAVPSQWSEKVQALVQKELFPEAEQEAQPPVASLLPEVQP